MKTRSLHSTLAAALLLAAAFYSQPGSPAAQNPLPVPAEPPPHRVKFLEEVHPILMQSCAQCHLAGRDKGGFQFDTRELLLKGGDTGPAVIPGKADESYLIQLVEGKVEGLAMPMKGRRLTADEIATLRTWIDQGTEWEAGAKATMFPKADLAPRRVELPPETPATGSNPIDRILGIDFGQPVGDAAYMRRVYLDATGLLPGPVELAEFCAGTDPAKRERLAANLLSNSRAYAEHWMTWWNDLLRNDFVGTGYIDGGRKQITGWLYRSLARNTPYDEFARQLVHPTPESEGFIKGIVWRGVTNASQTPPMQAAQNLSQVFMGTNLKCASCHDSFVNNWRLQDAYGLAAVFSDEPLELVRCDAPQGEMAQMRFLYPELGEIDPALPRAERLAQLASLLTRPENGRFARTIVNRLWARFLGRGIVEPVDDMDQKPWNADLLDWLAADLVDHGYDLKHTMQVILTSRAYQLPAVPGGEVEEKEFVFHGPVVRRMSAEQLIDAFGCLTGVWQSAPGVKVDLDLGSEASQRDAAKIRKSLESARWIWLTPDANVNAPVEPVFFRKTFKLENLDSKPVTQANLVVVCDNEFSAFVNGVKVGQGKDYTKPTAINIAPRLVEGINIIAIKGANVAPGGPAGLLAFARITRGEGDAAEDMEIATDKTWLCTREEFRGWHRLDFLPFEWPAAAELGPTNAAPWNLAEAFAEGVLSAGSEPDRIRAWLANADPLMRALGRPNREQVMTRRQTVATTLETLEMTNGATLAQMLKQGSEELAKSGPVEAGQLATRLYVQSFGRKPSAKELELARETLGSPVRPEGIEDFVWTLIMSPEFQLIY